MTAHAQVNAVANRTLRLGGAAAVADTLPLAAPRPDLLVDGSHYGPGYNIYIYIYIYSSWICWTTAFTPSAGRGPCIGPSVATLAALPLPSRRFRSVLSGAAAVPDPVTETP